MLSISGSLLGFNALADSAAQIEATTGAVTYDNASGEYPVISSILSSPGVVDGYTFKNYVFQAQDSTGSLEMYMSSTATYTPTGYTPNVGDTVSVTGTYGAYDGFPELESPGSVTYQGAGTAPGATVVTIPEINQTSTMANGLLNQYSGYYIQLDNVTITGAPAAFPTHATGTYGVTDGVNSMVLYFWASSYSSTAAYGGTTVPTGEVDMDGFVDFYAGSSEAEFVPTTITPVASVPEPSALNLCGAGSALAYVVSRLRKKA